MAGFDVNRPLVVCSDPAATGRQAGEPDALAIVAGNSVRRLTIRTENSSVGAVTSETSLITDYSQIVTHSYMSYYSSSQPV